MSLCGLLLYLEAVGGELRLWLKTGRRTMMMMSPRMIQMGQKHESMWPLTLRLWEVRLKVWLKTGRRTMTMMSQRMIQMGQKHESMWPLTLRLWEMRLRLWLKMGRRTIKIMSEDDADGTET